MDDDVSLIRVHVDSLTPRGTRTRASQLGKARCALGDNPLWRDADDTEETGIFRNRVTKAKQTP